MNKKNKQVMVAFSGGIDSTSAALKLKKSGYNISGLFAFFNQQNVEQLPAVENTAKQLEIPLKTLDLRQKFKQQIQKPLIQSYLQGETPNPCVLCNKIFKFGLLLDYATKNNYPLIATGHYAKIKHFSNKYHLLQAKDKNKDQSYFLYKLNQKQLSHIIFPLSNIKKAQAKKFLEKNSIHINQSESSDICFVNQKKFNQYLSVHTQKNPGPIINQSGQTIGEHNGLQFYTLGQRQGIGVGGSGPYYVCQKKQPNILMVTNNPQDKRLYSNQTTINNTNWILDEKPKLNHTYLAQKRYQSKFFSIKFICIDKNTAKINFIKKQKNITPGQSLVVYKKNKNPFKNKLEVLGGGIITNS